MSTTTSRLALYKPADDGSEFVDVSTDLNQNLDKLDAVIGFIPVTSSTHPGSPFPGMAIQETDTGRAYYRDGANAAWVQVPTSAGTFDSNVQLTSTRKIGLGVAPTAIIDVLNSNSTDVPARFKASGDSFFRHIVNWNGFELGSGAAATDVAVFRSGVGTLSLTGNLDISGTLDVSGQTTLDDTTVVDLDVSGDFTWQSYALPKWIEGQEAFSIASGAGNALRVVNFGVTLPRIPRIFCNLDGSSGQMSGWNARAITPSATGFTMGLYSNGTNTTLASTTNVQWVAFY